MKDLKKQYKRELAIKANMEFKMKKLAKSYAATELQMERKLEEM